MIEVTLWVVTVMGWVYMAHTAKNIKTLIQEEEA